MTTYYVDGAVGNDANAGTSEGAGNAWATVDKAMNTVVAGDKVWVKASATYSETPNIDTAGANTNIIDFEGYTTTTGDEGKATISGTTNCLTGSISGSNYYRFANFIFSGASSTGVSLGTADDMHFFNCEFNSNGGAGADVDARVFFVNCEFNSNTGAGLDTAQVYLAGCIVANNGDNGVTSTAGAIAYKNVIYGVPATKTALQLTSSGQYVLQNTIDCENAATTTGIDIGSDIADAWLFDNIIYDCATGVAVNAAPWTLRVIAAYNLINSNTTDYSNTPGLNFKDVTGAPAFTNEAGDDYTLGASSAAIDAGMNPGGVT